MAMSFARYLVYGVSGLCEARWAPIDCPLPLPAAKSAAVLKQQTDLSAPCPRSSHGCTTMGDVLLVLGGEVVARTPIDSRVFARNLRGGEWMHLAVEGVQPPARVAHTQCAVGQYLYIFGGRQGILMDEAPLNDMWRFNLMSRKWTKIIPEAGTAPVPRSFHKMIAVGADIYVYGGCAAKGRLADLHHFDTKTGAWAQLAAAPAGMHGRGGAGFCAGADGDSLFVVGGFTGEEANDLYRFDRHQGKWELLLPQGNAKIRPFSVSCSALLRRPGVGASVIVFFGGEVDPSDKGHEGAGGFSDTLLVLDASTGEVLPCTTTALSSGPIARGWTDADSWGDDKLVLFGGLAGDDTSPLRLADAWTCQICRH